MTSVDLHDPCSAGLLVTALAYKPTVADVGLAVKKSGKGPGYVYQRWDLAATLPNNNPDKGNARRALAAWMLYWHLPPVQSLVVRIPSNVWNRYATNFLVRLCTILHFHLPTLAAHLWRTKRVAVSGSSTFVKSAVNIRTWVSITSLTFLELQSLSKTTRGLDLARFRFAGRWPATASFGA